MERAAFDEVWTELKSESEETGHVYEISDEMSGIIVKLIETRIEKGYTQRQIAEKCGLKQAAIARMESLKTIPRLDTLIRYASALGLTITLDPNKVSDSEMKTFNGIQMG